MENRPSSGDFLPERRWADRPVPGLCRSEARKPGSKKRGSYGNFGYAPQAPRAPFLPTVGYDRILPD